MSHSRMDKKDPIDIAPAQSHDHQEVAAMHTVDKAVVTREPYGKPGMFTLNSIENYQHLAVSILC